MSTASASESDSQPIKKMRSRFRGVAWDSKHESWRVKIFYRGKQRHVGRYSDEVEAAEHYDSAAVYLYGGYARTNFGLPAVFSAGTKVSKPIIKARLLTDLTEQHNRHDRRATARAFSNPSSRLHQPHLFNTDTRQETAAPSDLLEQVTPVPCRKHNSRRDLSQSAAASISGMTTPWPTSGMATISSASSHTANSNGTALMLVPGQQHDVTTEQATSTGGPVHQMQLAQDTLSPQTAQLQTPVQQTLVPGVMMPAQNSSQNMQLVMNNTAQASFVTQQPAVLTQQLNQQVSDHVVQQPHVYQQALQQQAQQPQYEVLVTDASARAPGQQPHMHQQALQQQAQQPQYKLLMTDASATTPGQQRHMHQQALQQQVYQQYQLPTSILPTTAPLQLSTHQLSDVVQLTAGQMSDVVLYRDQDVVLNRQYTEVPAQDAPAPYLVVGPSAVPGTSLIRQASDGSWITLRSSSTSSSNSWINLRSSSGSSTMQRPVVRTVAEQCIVSNNRGYESVILQTPRHAQALPDAQLPAVVMDQDGRQYQLVYQPASHLVAEPQALDMPVSMRTYC